MNAANLINALDYNHSPNWNDIETVSVALDDAWKVSGVKGFYTVETSPENHKFFRKQKVVYVAEASDAMDARRIHKSLWNVSDAPFLIVVLPNQIRIYSCFTYNKTGDSDLLTIDSNDLNVILEALAEFKAANIDSGDIWLALGKKIDVQQKVDRHLLASLGKLSLNLIHERGLSPIVAHSLIGKYIYIRYLRDRGIITDSWLSSVNISIDRVLGVNTDVKDLVKLTDALQTRFSGQIFPIDFNRMDAPTDNDVSFVASVFRGDHENRLSFGFDLYDFSYIPIEMLSSIYEQFLHIEDVADLAGAFYTPEPLADYLISELNHFSRLSNGFKILDPSCGSGVFLVLCYRRLINLSMHQKGRNLSPGELKAILEESIYGVERNREACYVTEFSLILMLLNFIDPPDLHKNQDFKFPELHNKRIFESDFFDNNSKFWRQNLKFDWIIGNPPWIEIEQNSDEINSRHVVKWIKENADHRTVARYRTSEAFLWRCGDVVKRTGYIGLLIQASSLTNQQSDKFRSTFFSYNRVHKVTNFSNLSYILFAGRAQEPTASIVYQPNNTLSEKELANRDRWQILHFGPLVANQAMLWNQKNKQSWTITITESEISYINYKDIENGDILYWKLALWGTSRDHFVLSEIRRLMPHNLSELCEIRGWNLALGLQLRGDSDSGKNLLVSELEGKKILNHKLLHKSKNRYTIPIEALETNQKPFVRKRGGYAGLGTIAAPHLVLGFNASYYSDIDFILHHPVPALSASAEDTNYLKALSIYMNSFLARYILFFTSPTWGASRTSFNKLDAENLPVPDFTAAQILELSDLFDNISDTEQGYMHDAHLDTTEIEQKFVKILGIPIYISQIVTEFFEYRIKYNKGKVPSFVNLQPTRKDIERYAKTLLEELNDYIPIIENIDVYRENNYIACAISFTDIRQNSAFNIHDGMMDPNISEQITSAMSFRGSQWVYTQKSIKIFLPEKFIFIKPNKKYEWLITSAMNDADEIINEMIHHASLHSESGSFTHAEGSAS